MVTVSKLRTIAFVSFISLLSACGGGGGGGNPPPSNSSPVANAGVEQSVNEGTQVTLSGSGSDTDGTIASVTWSQTAGASVIINNANSTNASFVAPEVTADETLTFRFTVTDDDGASDTDDVNVIVQNVAPANVKPSVSVGQSQSIQEGETLQVTAAVSDTDGTVTSVEWQQISGPAFNIVSGDSVDFVATAPLIDSDSTAVFQVTVTDDDGEATQVNLDVSVSVAQQALKTVSTAVSLPDEVDSVAVNEISVSSISSNDGQVVDSEQATLLLGQSGGNTVLLSTANGEGGLQGENAGEVDVSIETTTATAVAFVNGTPAPAIDRVLISNITSLQGFPTVVTRMSNMLSSDSGYLDNIMGYPNELAVLSDFAGNLERFGKPTLSKSDDVSSHSKDATNNQAGKQDVVDDFWCASSGYPCSPWGAQQPWSWYGSASGIEDLTSNVSIEQINELLEFTLVAGTTVKSIVGETGYATLLNEASSQPFFSFSTLEQSIHAVGNPGFANYAMELYEGDSLVGSYRISRNSTLIQKLLNSGAAYNEFDVGEDNLLNPNVDRVVFNRYRFTGAGTSLGNEATVISFFNTLNLLAATYGLFADASELLAFMEEALQVDDNTSNILACSAELRNTIDFDDDNDTSDIEVRAFNFAINKIPAITETLQNSTQCSAIRTVGGKTLGTVFNKQYINSIATVLDQANDDSWTRLLFSEGSDIIPVWTSYLSAEAASVEYYLTWSSAGDDAYISNAGPYRLPTASFNYEQAQGLLVFFDASGSTSQNNDLNYQWLINNEVIGDGTQISYNFSAPGRYAVTLVIEDGRGNISEFTGSVTVENGVAPQISSLLCEETGNGKEFIMTANFTDADNDIVEVNWFSSNQNDTPTQTTSGSTTSVTVTSSTDKLYEFAKVQVIDSLGNQDVENCKVTFTPQAANQPPTANAGEEQTVSEGESVTLDGSLSNDVDGSIVSYIWEQITGTTVALSNADSAVASFIAPQVSADEVVTFELTVTDDDGAVASVLVNVTVLFANDTPTVNAGFDQYVDEGSIVTLEGSAVDDDGTIVSYQWTQTSGIPVSLSAASTANPSFVAPDVVTQEELIFELLVTDNNGANAADRVSVFVFNRAPSGIDYQGFVLTTNTVTVGGDYDQACRIEYGSNWGQAEWEDLRSWVFSGGDLDSLVFTIGLDEFSPAIKRNGQAPFSEFEDYYIEFTNGDIPSSGVIYDEIGNYLFSLFAGDNERFVMCQDLTIFNPVPASQPLNDTGIVDFYESGDDASYGRDVLASTGQLNKIGAGDAGFDFTKLDQDGNDLPASAEVWSCVRDNHTGLIWEVKTTDGGLRDAFNLFTWYNPDPNTNGGVAGLENDGMNTYQYVLDVNAQGLCGASDWRLPTPAELQSIVHYGLSDIATDLNYFPNIYGYWYWSSATSSTDNFSAVDVSFFDGYIGIYNKELVDAVRLVRN